MTEILRALLLRDFLLKLFALAAAVLIWVSVSLAIRREAVDTRTFRDLTVLVLSGAADVRDVRISPRTLDVTVRGEREALSQLQAQDVRVMVDVTGVESARDLRRRVDVAIPSGVTLVRVIPETVDVVVPAKR
jgi:hypothetical protein